MKFYSVILILPVFFLQSCGCGSDIKLGKETLSDKSESMFPYIGDMDPLVFSANDGNTITMTNGSGDNLTTTETVHVNTLCEEGINIQSEYYEVEAKNIKLDIESEEFWYSIKSNVSSINNSYQLYDNIYFSGNLNGTAYFFNGVIDQKNADLPDDESLFTSEGNQLLNGKLFENIFRLQAQENGHVMYVNAEFGLIAFGTSENELFVLNI